MNFHQTPEEIIKNATAEQRILWNYIFLRFGENIGLSQLYFSGVHATSEFFTYSARKIYFALILRTAGDAAAGAVSNTLTLYDEANASSLVVTNNMPVWDTTAVAVKFINNTVVLNNVIFSRMTLTVTRMSFVGYRLSI